MLQVSNKEPNTHLLLLLQRQLKGELNGDRVHVMFGTVQYIIVSLNCLLYQESEGSGYIPHASKPVRTSKYMIWDNKFFSTKNPVSRTRKFEDEKC